RHLADAVFVPEQRDRLLVEDLDRRPIGLTHDLAAELHIGVVPQILALVDEALAVQVDHDHPRVRVLLEIVEHLIVAVRRGRDIPADRVTPRPVAIGPRADLEGHANAVAHIVLGAAHTREIPAGAEIARPHLRAGFETAARQDHGARLDLLEPVRPAHFDAGDAALPVVQQTHGTGLVAELAAELQHTLDFGLHEAGTAAHGLDVHAAIEVLLAVDE